MSGKSYNQVYSSVVHKIKSTFEASQLLSFVTGLDRSRLPLVGGKTATLEEVRQLESLVARRLAGEPLQYILEVWEFYGLPFKVGKGVLIPRPDTEVLVEKGLELSRGLTSPVILDLCAGSGAVGISLERNLKNPESASVTAVELSPTAYGYLCYNIALNKSSVVGVNADVLKYTHPEKVDIILSNPPYIPSAHIAGLQKEVLQEPSMALDGGDDGLDFYKKIPPFYFTQLKKGGVIVFEVGINQQEAVAEILRENGFKNIGFQKDLGGIPRIVWGEKTERKGYDC